MIWNQHGSFDIKAPHVEYISSHQGNIKINFEGLFISVFVSIICAGPGFQQTSETFQFLDSSLHGRSVVFYSDLTLYVHRPCLTLTLLPAK